MRRLGVVAIAGFAVFFGVSAPGAMAAKGGGKPTFGPDFVLPGGQGAEPSFAIDTSATPSRNFDYVVAIGDPNGPLEWHS
jgi:hypothetical protein